MKSESRALPIVTIVMRGIKILNLACFIFNQSFNQDNSNTNEVLRNDLVTSF